jgi:hypothetical protein
MHGRLRMAKCKYGDPTCPCQDGDLCHYEGKNAWPAPHCPRCGVSLLSYRPVSEFDDAHHLSRDGERPAIRCADIVNK